jgi:nitronate monooxygenase
MSLPIIIQGGMGVGVSNWSLARAVSKQGQLGVVSSTLLAVVLARRLQQGDPDGDLRRALSHFPVPAMAERVCGDWFIAGGQPSHKPFKSVEMPTLNASPAFIELTVVANFVEVFLAKEHHSGVVGINLLEKIQLPTLPSLYGAMLAGVDYVLMGAGIPRAIPGVLDQFSRGEAASLKIDLTPAANAETPTPDAVSTFDPSAFLAGPAPTLKRPQFLAIVSSATLALTLARKSTGQVDGFVIETESAGGHNAPPRGPLQLTSGGEPVYGERDLPDIAKIRALGLPFWLAGAYATPEKLAEARQLGAAGVQIGTAFAFCAESGMTSQLKYEVGEMSRAGLTRVFTDPFASPTGFPFKVLQHPHTLAEPGCYENRPRICDLGYLREAYTQPDGAIGYRCGGEPIGNFLRKGGTRETSAGRKCLCNCLLATVGLGQTYAHHEEPPMVTAGHDVQHLQRFLPADGGHYHAVDVIRSILGPR